MGYEVDSFGRNAHDPYIDDGVEDLDDREAAGYYDENWVGGDIFALDPRDEHFDTREEANGER